MPSHSAIRLVSQRALPGERVEATFELACGCTVTRELPADRLLERADGTPYVAGKYPCPQGHPVAPPKGV